MFGRLLFRTPIHRRVAYTIVGATAASCMLYSLNTRFALKTSITHSAEEAPTQSYRADQVATQKQVQEEMHGEKVPIYRIVLTGGPCGGKSTAITMISDRLLSLGFRVFRVPEAATLLFSGTSLNPGLMSERERQAFEGTIIKTKMALEDLFYELARSGSDPCVIICDRGTMDTAAYMSSDNFDVLLDDWNWNVVDLRDKRYDAVIHLVTAAIGAENFYTTENNAARSEDLNQARDLDFKVLNAWVGHPHIRIVDNSTAFAQKINRVEEIICQVVGAPRPMRGERKFIVSNDSLITQEIASSADIKVETYQIDQIYLTKSSDLDGYNYVRRRGMNGTYTYTHSMVRHSSEAEKIVLERSITGREYVGLLKQSDPNRTVVKKKVQCFLWNNVYYELQTFVDPDIKLTVLKTEVEPQVKAISFPWFLNVKSEITDSNVFSSYFLSEHYDSQKVRSLDWKDNQLLRETYNASREEWENSLKKKVRKPMNE